jgi:hypothetical protein
MIDLEFQEKKAAQELNILRTKNDEQLYGESEKARIQRDNDKAKADGEINLAHVKNKMAVDHESEKSRVRLEGETAKVKAKGDHKNLATGKKQEVDAVKEIAESFTKGMAEITGAMTQALNAPKTISVKRDASGKVVGATAT